jgi:hypothetical protein
MSISSNVGDYDQALCRPNNVGSGHEPLGLNNDIHNSSPIVTPRLANTLHNRTTHNHRIVIIPFRCRSNQTVR